MPLERKSLDSQVAAASANLEATKDRARHIEMEKKKLELDVGTRNESIARLKTQQYETRKNDEFSAIGREIERYQNEINALEDQELELMEQADVLKAQITAEEKQTAAAKDSIAKQIANLDTKQATLTGRLEELKKGAGRARDPGGRRSARSIQPTLREQGRRGGCCAGARCLHRLPHENNDPNGRARKGRQRDRELRAVRPDSLFRRVVEDQSGKQAKGGHELGKQEAGKGRIEEIRIYARRARQILFS